LLHVLINKNLLGKGCLCKSNHPIIVVLADHII